MRKVGRASAQNAAETYTWTKARREGPENAELSADEWREKGEEGIADLRRQCQGLSKDAEVTAFTPQMLNPRLPAALVRQWSTAAQT